MSIGLVLAIIAAILVAPAILITLFALRFIRRVFKKIEQPLGHTVVVNAPQVGDELWERHIATLAKEGWMTR